MNNYNNKSWTLTKSDIFIIAIILSYTVIAWAGMYCMMRCCLEANREPVEVIIREVIEYIPEEEKPDAEAPEAEERPSTEEIEQINEVSYFDVPLSEDLQDHIFSECEKYGVDPAIIIAMIERESTFRESVVGDNGNSFGLMQIQPRWHKARMERLNCDNLLDPYQNVTVGVDLLAELIDTGRGLDWALMAYNGGPGYANKQVASVVAYRNAVMDNYRGLVAV